MSLIFFTSGLYEETITTELSSAVLFPVVLLRATVVKAMRITVSSHFILGISVVILFACFGVCLFLQWPHGVLYVSERCIAGDFVLYGVVYFVWHGGGEVDGVNNVYSFHGFGFGV